MGGVILPLGKGKKCQEWMNVKKPNLEKITKSSKSVIKYKERNNYDIAIHASLSPWTVFKYSCLYHQFWETGKIFIIILLK